MIAGLFWTWLGGAVFSAIFLGIFMIDEGWTREKQIKSFSMVFFWPLTVVLGASYGAWLLIRDLLPKTVAKAESTLEIELQKMDALFERIRKKGGDK